MQSSLLNFFTPITKKKEKDSEAHSSPTRNVESPMRSIKKPLSTRNKKTTDNSPIKAKSPARKRVILDSSDEEEENRTISKKTKVDLSSFSHDQSRSESVLDTSICNESVLNVTTLEDEEPVKQWQHLTLEFLKPDKIRDKCKRAPSDPDYDSHTLYVPPAFISTLTPGMKQWWIMKQDYYDTLLFFKVGKFYELYHMDAVIGVEELGIAYMRGAFAHSGFPEKAFPRFAEILVRKGFKVARVEQTETPDAMNERTKGLKNQIKAVRREICQIVTPGTATESLRTCTSTTHDLSDNNALTQDLQNCLVSDNEPLLLALKFKVLKAKKPDTLAECRFGVAFMNARTGEVCLGEFEDDRNLSRLRTLLSHFPPTQILIERGNLPADLVKMLNTIASGVPIESLKSGSEFLSSADLISELETSCYFDALKPSISPEELPETWSSRLNWPPAVIQLIDKEDPTARKIDLNHQLAGDCFGALIHYLRYCLIDREILTLGMISEYQPLDCTQQNLSSKTFYERQKHMVLDSVTMTNLDILKNVATGTVKGSLIEQLDNCSTPFGRRLLRKWVSAPLCHPEAIKSRQEAVTDLIEWGLDGKLKATLKSLPDLERLITKVHLMGSNGATEEHPESRAILFEEIAYSTSKITDFVATVKGFNLASNFIQNLHLQPMKSSLLRNLCTLATDEESPALFPDLQEELRYFERAFDHETAKKQGRLVPERGVDKDFDSVCDQLKEVETQIEEHLLECGKEIGCRLTYWGTGRNRLQIEVPENKLKNVPRDWQMSSQKKGFKRYRTKETNDLLARLMQAEDRKDYAVRHIMRRIFAKFSTHYHKFHAAVKCLAELDCLISLAEYSCKIDNLGGCMPNVLPLCSGVEPMLRIVEGRHPCLGSEMIPNDLLLGCEESKAKCVVVTGPNMGGKSTLMRQTALIALLAHLGCRVPAECCELTPIDRIFTRLGASDRLLAGESTFMVELSECASILRHCSVHSLILMDELGRGTSTHDGSALASSVLHYLTDVSPRCLFSTHYHTLLDNKEQVSKIGMGHMACMVEEPLADGDGDKEDLDFETVHFLYKFVPGQCPKSYGFNAARLAQIPDKITRYAVRKAREFEKVTTTFAVLRDLLQTDEKMSLECLHQLRKRLEIL